MHSFKVGDKVRYVRGPGASHTDWAQRNGLILGQVYIVTLTDNTSMKVRPHGGPNFWINHRQFDPFKISNEERVKQRMEKLNA